MAIDTDDLSDKTYNAIIIEAEKFNHDLTLQFGLLSYSCSDEKDYIEKSEMLINEMLKFDKNGVEFMFFGNPPSIESFHKTLHKILVNITKLKTSK